MPVNAYIMCILCSRTYVLLLTNSLAVFSAVVKDEVVQAAVCDLVVINFSVCDKVCRDRQCAIFSV